MQFQGFWSWQTLLPRTCWQVSAVMILMQSWCKEHLKHLTCHSCHSFDVQNWPMRQKNMLPGPTAASAPCGWQKSSWHGAIMHSAVLSCVLIWSYLSLLSNWAGFWRQLYWDKEETGLSRCPNCGLAEILACRGFFSDSKQHANTFPHTLHFISTPSNMSQKDVCYVSRAKKQHFVRRDHMVQRGPFSALTFE